MQGGLGGLCLLDNSPISSGRREQRALSLSWALAGYAALLVSHYDEEEEQWLEGEKKEEEKAKDKEVCRTGGTSDKARHLDYK